MKRILLVTPEGVEEGDESLLRAWRENDRSRLWLDLQDEDAVTESDFLQQEFGIDEFEINEAQRSRYPPSIGLHSDYAYLLLKPLDTESHDLDFGTLQLAMFVGERYVITRRSRGSHYLEMLWQGVRAGTVGFAAPAAVLSAMTRRITDRYAGVLLGLENRLDVIEDEIFETATDSLMRELVSYNTSLRKMRRIIAYHQNVFQQLEKDSQVTGRQGFADEIAEISALMQRNTSLADLYQSVITDLIDGYISLNGHHLNQIMKVLTIVTVVFVPITFLAGIYGMNFENIPELRSAYGYYILLSVMATVVLTLLYAFRRIRWL